MRVKFIAAMALLLLASLTVSGQDARGKAEVTIKGKKIAIDYGRPALQGRDMIGMAKPGMTWRMGMDEATEIETTATLVVGGKELKPGKYTLWAKKTSPTEWSLAFHPQTGVWGDPPLETGYVAQTPLKLAKAANSAEQLTISLAAGASGDAVVTVHWGTSQLTASVGVK